MAVGARIKQLREERNLSIEQIASATKLRRDVISFIEAEEWQKLDLPVFVRNQIRLIANAIEANESELLEMFESDLPSDIQSSSNLVQSKPNEMNIFEKQGKSALPAKRNPNLLYFIIGFVVVAAVVVFAVFSQTNADNSLPETDVTASESQTPNDSTSPSPQSSDPSVDLLGVSVVLQATGRSWITATGSAGNSLFSSFLNANDTITLTDSTSIALVIGDSGVINVTVNDENLGFLGGLGAPIEITFPLQ